MFKLKVVLLLLAVANCSLVMSCMDPEGTDSQVVDQVVLADEAAGKINWGPVWDDQEGNNEFVTRNLEENSKEDNQNCAAPNGLGLQNLFQEVEKILPKQQIKNIVKSYAEDAEIKALKAFAKNPQTIDKIQAIRSSQEYQILKDYICRILHIDLIKYHKLVRTIINPLLTRAGSQPRKGIRGLIHEVDAVLPRQQLRQLYQTLLATDEELAKAVANLKSQEFYQLLLNVKNNVSEYKALREQLMALNVPVEDMRELLANTLGWAPEMGLFV